jgi:hypothetical protein
MAGVPKAVHGEFSRESPVDVNPSGAGPIAAGVKITGVALKSSDILVLPSAIYLLASSYRSMGIWRPSRTRFAVSASRSPDVEPPMAAAFRDALARLREVGLAHRTPTKEAGDTFAVRPVLPVPQCGNDYGETSSASLDRRSPDTLCSTAPS